MHLTEEQERAIKERDKNVLLSAAAGSGKTTVLVARVLDLIMEGKSIDRMLIVTFTRAASADMRAKLQKELSKSASEGNDEMRRQLLLLERANISTLHAFCSDFLRVHFEIANVDPAFRILDPAEARRLQDEALDEALEEFYTDPDEDARMLDYARGPKQVRTMADLLLKALDERPDPQAWLDRICSPDDAMRSAWIDEVHRELRASIRVGYALTKQAMQHPDCPANYVEALAKDLETIEIILKEETYDGLQRAAAEFKQTAAKRVKGVSFEGEIKELRDRAKKCIQNCASDALPLGPALEDMKRLEPEFRALGRLAMRARQLLEERKSEIGALTYSDLEHKTLEALADEETAASMREQFDCIFVDEYQDTSDVQEALVGCITRGNNLFMVGDVKQSIYRFRHAEPRLFLEKYERYQKGDGGILLSLTRNFRSRPGVLDFVNRIFETTMTGGDSEILYDEHARLNLGSAELTGGSAELHILTVPDEEEADEALAEMKDCEREAVFIAGKIRELMAEVPNLRFRDIAVLTRTKQNVLNKMASVLMQAGIPAYADCPDDFYDSMEVSLALSLLKLTANRRSDVELIGVLRSPLVGLSDDELARIRIASPSTPFVDAASAYAAETDAAAERLRKFFEMCAHWRLASLSSDLGALCRRIFKESGLMDCAGALPGGEQRQANLLRLADDAAAFDQNVSGSLSRFLQHTKKLREQSDGAEAHLLGENDDVVRMMTVHKSKGLEFPVVFGAVLSRQRNSQSASLRTHRDLGIGCNYCDPKLRTRRKTIVQRAIDAREKRESSAEELRILYVMLTRAKDRLILTGTTKNAEKILARQAILHTVPENAKTLLEMILSGLDGTDDPKCPITFHEEISLAAAEQAEELPMGADAELEAAMLWQYPDSRAASQPLKLTVTGIVRELHAPKASEALIERPVFLSEEPKRMSGAERGTAVHRAMECLDFVPMCDMKLGELSKEVERQLDALCETGRITGAQREVIPANAIAKFLMSRTGLRLRASGEVHREWAFNVLMRVREALTPEEAAGYADEEFLVQGTIDCCFIENGQWVLLDYKTDRTNDAEALTQRYQKQLQLYASALERITGMGVSEIRLCLVLTGEEIEISPQ